MKLRNFPSQFCWWGITIRNGKCLEMKCYLLQLFFKTPYLPLPFRKNWTDGYLDLSSDETEEERLEDDPHLSQALRHGIVVSPALPPPA